MRTPYSCETGSRAARTHRLRWWGLAVLTVPVFITAMDISILYTAVPMLSADLRPGAGELLWILDAYGFAIAGLLILMGNLGDRIGRRRLLLVGAAGFGAASLLAALSWAPEVLILARALMGIAGATLLPSTLSLIRNMFDDATERSRAIGVWAAGFGGGPALGPVLGGSLLEVFPWGSVFLINVPVVVLLLLVTPRLVPEFRHPRPGRWDLTSVALSFVAILPLVWAIKTAAEQLAVTAWVAVAALIGFAGGIWFVARQRRLASPLVDIGLFSRPRFTGAVLSGALAMFSLIGVMLYSSQYLQLVLGHSPLIAALWLLPVLASVAVSAVGSPMVAARIGHPSAFGLGAALMAAGLLLLSTTPVDPDLADIVVLLAGAVCFGTGVSPIMTMAADLVVGTVSPNRSGAASAISETAGELGGALGVAVLGSIGAVAYRADVAAALPKDVPAEAAEVIGSGLGAAMEVAEELPGESAAGLRELAAEAFVSGLGAATGTAAIVMAGLAVLAPVLLSRPTASAPDPGGENPTDRDTADRHP